MKAADGTPVKDEYDQEIESTLEAIWELRRTLNGDSYRRSQAAYGKMMGREVSEPNPDDYTQRQIRTLSEAIARRTGQSSEEVLAEHTKWSDDMDWKVRDAKYTMPRALSQLDLDSLKNLKVGERPTPTQRKILEGQHRLEGSDGVHHIDRYIGDRQRERLYKAEDKALPNMFTKDFENTDEAQKFARGITSSDWWREHFPNAKTVQVKGVNSGNQQAALADGHTGKISLPDNMLSKHVLLHEMAHIASGGVVEGHGPQFAKNYHALVEQFIGPDEAKALKREFETAKIRMASEPGTVFADRETMKAVTKLSLEFSKAEDRVKALRRRLRDGGLDADHPDAKREKEVLKDAEKRLRGFRAVIQEIIQDGQWTVGKNGLRPLFKQRLRTPNG